MPFSDQGKALIKNLHQFKEYGSRRLLTEFAEIKWNKRAFNSLLKKIREIEDTDRRHRSGRPKHARTEENVTTDHSVDKLVLSQENQPKTHRSTRQLSRETGLTQSSVVRIICCDLGLNFLKCPKSRCAHELTAALSVTLMFHKVV